MEKTTSLEVRVIWDSSNPDVASIDGNGGIYANKTGYTTITAYAVPVNTRYVLTADAMPVAEDTLPYIPESAIKTKSITLSVVCPTSSSSNPSSSNSSLTTDTTTTGENTKCEKAYRLFHKK